MVRKFVLHDSKFGRIQQLRAGEANFSVSLNLNSKYRKEAVLHISPRPNPLTQDGVLSILVIIDSQNCFNAFIALHLVV